MGSPTAWDSITIGGLTWGTPAGPAAPASSFTGLDGVVATAPSTSRPTPNGSVRVEGAERRFSWDPKHGKSQEGWQPTYQGTKGKQFKLRFRMWTDAQCLYWEEYRKMFDYLLLKVGSGSTPISPKAIAAKEQVNALSVYHPKLYQLGITAIYVEIVGGLDQVGDDGLYESVVSVWEFRPPPDRPTTSTPKGASNGGKDATKERFTPTPQDAAVYQAEERRQAALKILDALEHLSNMAGDQAGPPPLPPSQ